MKILHINDIYRDFGGAERYLLNTCSALEDLGHIVVIISSSEGEKIHIPGRREYFLQPSWGIRSGLRLINAYKDIILKEDPDLIHLHNIHYFLSPPVIGALHKVKPVVKFVHDVRLICPNGKKIIARSDSPCLLKAGFNCLKHGCIPILDRSFINMKEMGIFFYQLRSARGLNKMIVGSRYMYDELIKNGFEKGKVALIPCYTDKIENGFIDSAKRDDEYLILCVGRFDGVKGIPQLIKSLALIREKRWRAEIVGDGEYQDEAINLAKDLGLEKKISFLGRLTYKKLDDHYQNASLVVMPSIIPESFGLVGIEAMAFGKPVIAFDSGGVSEWLLDKETGFLVKRGDIYGLARAIVNLLEDRGLAQRTGRRGKERVEALYRKARHIDALIQIYHEVIEKRSLLNEKSTYDRNHRAGWFISC